MTGRKYSVEGRFLLVLLDVWSLRAKVIWLVGG